MRKLLVLFILMLFTLDLNAQSTSKNYVKETIYRTESNSGGNIGFLFPPNFENIIYKDGLGRTEQLVEKNASPVDDKNIVKHIEYEKYTGQTKDYLPFTVEGKVTTSSGLGFIQTTYNGNFVDNAKASTLNYYNTEENEFTQNPFSEVKVKKNLKKEVEEVASPGTDWAMANKRTVKLETTPNTANEVKWFTATATWNSTAKAYTNTLVNTGYFTAGSLTKQIVKNENWTAGKNNTTEVFKGTDGKIHLKRAYNDGYAHDTYYVYNQLGQLTYVLTPDAVDKPLNAEVLNELCFQYHYDANGMLVEKKVPGKKWEYIVYDKGGRVALSGPNLNPFGTGEEGWLFIKYDYLNRPVYKGFYTGHTVSAANRAALDNALKTQTVHNEKRQSTTTVDGISISYTNQVFPTASITLLDVNYYDGYDFANAPATLENVNGVAPNANVKGLLTGVWTRNLTTAAEKKGDLTYLAYDHKYRPIRINTTNAQGGLTQVNSKYNFIGNPTQIQTIHKKTNAATPITTLENFTYNSREYLLKHTHTINGQTEELIASYVYDELGKLIRKDVGNNVNKPLQKIDYKYNVRGWLKQINNPDNLDEKNDNDLFGLTINYNTAQNVPASVKKQYNGNVSSVVWKTRTDNIKRGYVYNYDDLNRLTEATSLKNNVISADFQELVGYNKNGNIIGVERTGGNINGQVVEIDRVSYNYAPNSNKLVSVDDHSNHTEGINDFNKNGNDYAYDTFGNLVVDKNRKITNISYNHLNQPVVMTFATGDNITFTYDSYGNRIKKTVTQNGVSDVIEYIDGYEYKNNQLKYIATNEGFIKFENNQYHYVYQHKDQIGNVRLTYQDSNKNGIIENTEILNESNYYPFGLKHGHYNQLANNFSNSLVPNAGFNGQAHLVDLEANLSLMDFRMYDGALGRFLGVDLLADWFTNQSPYHFGYNNPISFIDPTGLHNDPARPNVTSGSWGELVEIDGYDGWELIIYTSSNKNDGFILRGTDPHAQKYMEMSYAGGSYGGGPGGGGPSRGGGSSRENPSPRGASNGVLEGVQTALDVAGLVPGFGEIADGINAIIYAANGDYVNASLSLAAMVPLGGQLATAGKLGMKVADATNVVYRGIDKSGVVKYVGITKRVPGVRFGEHLNSGTAKSLLRYEVIDGATGLTRTQARVWEQTLINQYGLGNLLNKRNSISPKYWEQYGIK